MSEWEDRPKSVRSGEELDGDRLAAYLQTELPDLSGSFDDRTVPAVFQFDLYGAAERDRIGAAPARRLSQHIKSARHGARIHDFVPICTLFLARVPRPCSTAQTKP